MRYIVLKNYIDNFDKVQEQLCINGVYYIRHIDKPYFYYIGSTTRDQTIKLCRNGLYGRWIEHFSQLRKHNHYNSYLQRIVNKYGLSGLRFGIIKVSFNNEEILQDEQYYIDLIRHNSDYHLLNLSITANKVTMSEENRKKHSKRMKLDNPMKRPNAVKKSKNIGQLLSLKIQQFDLKGNFIQEWSSIKEAADYLNVDPSNISRAANGHTKSCRGFIWLFKDISNPAILIEKINQASSRKKVDKEAYLRMAKTNSRPVAQYNLKNELIKTYNSIKEAAETINGCIGNISRAASGKQNTSLGYIWKYITN